MVEDGIKKGYFPEQQQSQNHNQSIRMVECEA
jgi:hypothetical protein